MTCTWFISNEWTEAILKIKNGFVIVGIKDGIVYYFSKEYRIYDKWNQVPLLSLITKFENLHEEGTTDKPSRFLKSVT